MTKITISRFNNIRRPKKLKGGHRGPGYTFADQSIIEIHPDERLNSLVCHIENAVTQLRHGPAPTGISLASWKGATNHASNIIACHALVLDFRLACHEQLRSKIAKLGYACLFLDTEDKAATVNAITLIIPFSSSVTAGQYTRIASVVLGELDIYGALEGNLAATHIINIHPTTLAAYERGRLLDPEEFIARTASMYQGLDARKYEGDRPTLKARVQLEQPTYTSNDGLFEWAKTPAEILAEQARIPDLAAFGVMLPNG